MVSMSQLSPALTKVTQTVVSGSTGTASLSVIAVWWMVATRWIRVSESGGQPEQPITTSATTFAFAVAHRPHCTPGPRSVVTGIATCAARVSVSHSRARTKPALGDWSVAGYQVKATDSAWRA